MVIDTLQRIRTGSDSGNPYANDYRDISVLKALADKHHIAILLIHHLRKMNDDDPMNMISGTTGISGATDSNFVLKERRRGSGEATLYCTGRDIEYRELPLVFDKSGYTWRLTEPVEERISIDQAISLSAFLRGWAALRNGYGVKRAAGSTDGRKADAQCAVQAAGEVRGGAGAERHPRGQRTYTDGTDAEYPLPSV